VRFGSSIIRTSVNRRHQLDNSETRDMAVPTGIAPPAQQQPPQPARQQSAQVAVDDSRAVTDYGNFCRLTGTPEELLIDFGLNAQPSGTPTQPVQVSQRVVVNFYTAKRLAHALQLTVQRHEAVFGVLETDVQKRVRRT
jgi:hypothetical protein